MGDQMALYNSPPQSAIRELAQVTRNFDNVVERLRKSASLQTRHKRR